MCKCFNLEFEIWVFVISYFCINVLFFFIVKINKHKLNWLLKCNVILFLYYIKF
jgi:hypothetical protein